MKYKSRDNLRSKLIDLLSAQDEVYQICVFGTEVHGDTDRYSDIDLVVCSCDVAETYRKYFDIFQTVSPVIGRDCIDAAPKCYVEMLMLKDYSPYHKVDFSIVGALGDKKGFGPFKKVYENLQKRKGEKRRGDKSEIAAPLPGGVAQKLCDVLFSIPRFTKCLFRRDGINLYRRWASITNVTMVLWLEKYIGWQKEMVKKKLTPPEVRMLMEKINAGERRMLTAIFPSSAIMNAALSFQASIKQFISLSRQKAEYFQIPLDEHFINYMQRFMDAEIRRWENQTRKSRYAVIANVHYAPISEKK